MARVCVLAAMGAGAMNSLMQTVSSVWTELAGSIERSDLFDLLRSVAGLQALCAALGIAILVKAPLWVDLIMALFLCAWFSRAILGYVS
jgi:hypothetical protein